MQVNASSSAHAPGTIARGAQVTDTIPYTIRRGDTLGQIAARFGTDVQTLAAMNGIRNPNLIFPGRTIQVPSTMQSVTVQRGDTLAGIASRSGVSLQAVLRANPQIANPNRIYPGDRIAIPQQAASPRTAPPTAVGGVSPASRTSNVDGTLSLSPADIDNLKRTLQTEWVQSAGDAQAHGIIDTILNRTASGRWGSTVADVVNARYQFSDINGPVSWRSGRTSVEQIPMSRVSSRVDSLVDSYLAQRANGRPSSVGTHLNYANPHFSSRSNLGWIMALDGPVLGRGNAIHRHGTTPDLERHRPEPFAVRLPGGSGPVAASQPEAAIPGVPFDGHTLARAHGVEIKSRSVNISQLHPKMAPVIRAVAEAARELGLPTPVITSGNDSTHGNRSLHYADRALDFRGRNISIAQGNALRDLVSEKLGGDYDVLFETFPDRNNNHLHVEFDPN